MEALHLDVRRVLSDRHGPEAAALFRALAAFVDRRVAHLARTRCRDLISDADREEILGEVLYALMEGALGRFRGTTTAELQAFVRTMADRTTIRRAQRHLRERDADAVLPAPEPEPSPDERIELDTISSLDATDRAYLGELLQAGTQADLARAKGVSRAAVSQRVARIRERIDRMSSGQRAAHDAWMARMAAETLDRRC